MAAVYYTAGELADRIAENKDDWIPADFRLGSGLVYSSPATLAYNSPGAEGYGVKRAALAVPESVELIISPGCCGRNTSDISTMKGYENRFYYLELNEADIVTGRHLKRIPEAVKRILSDRASEGLPEPRVVMLVTTCVDALIGSDMDHVCRVCEAECGVKARPAYMYALTRDGVKPPMVQVRESIFSLLEKKEKKSHAVNILGYLGGLVTDSAIELKLILSRLGIVRADQISECKSFEDFMKMSEADFNLVLDPEARGAADYMEKNLDTGYIEMQRFYGIDRIYSQYKAFTSTFHADNDRNDRQRELCQECLDIWMNHIDEFSDRPVFSIGECCNAHAPELALAMMEYGFGVSEVFSTLSESDAYYVAEIADRNPSVKFYFNQHPSMVDYEPDERTGFCIGKDASWYYRNEEVPHLDWNSDVQPFGYHAVTNLMQDISWELGNFTFGVDWEDEKLRHIADQHIAELDWDEPEERRSRVSSDEQTNRLLGIMGFGGGFTPTVDTRPFVPLTKKTIHGYRRVLTPFAPDQSGAVAALRSIPDIMIVVLDAGGCTGNICGFDLNDWTTNPSMIFSAGLRDMDAVMGRDKELIAKIKSAVTHLHPSCIALVGTPVPSVIGTDLQGLAKQVKRETGLDTIAVNTTGIKLYDDGIIQAYRQMAEIAPDAYHGIYGLTGLDYSADEQAEIREKIAAMYGDLSSMGSSIALSLSGLEAAGDNIAPPELIVSDEMQLEVERESAHRGPILIVGEQVYSNAVRSIIKRIHPRKKIVVTGFFKMYEDLMQDDDMSLNYEDSFVRTVSSVKPSLIIGDPALKALIPDYTGRWVERRHFALSGR